LSSRLLLWTCVGVVLCGVWWGVARSQGPPAPDGSYWQAQAETLFQSRQACEQVQIQLRLQLIEMRDQRDALQQRVKALEDAKPTTLP
jgi:hypothetical protein